MEKHHHIYQTLEKCCSAMLVSCSHDTIRIQKYSTMDVKRKLRADFDKNQPHEKEAEYEQQG
jgi:Na+-translocating ferredoxin:NAD+ oxidoreductase RNF subunit RnfB